MSKTLSYITTFLTGIIITIMVVCNTELGQMTNIEFSSLTNQVLAIIFLSSLLILGRKNKAILPDQSSPKWYWYFGGAMGIIIVTVNYLTVINIGATLAMAGAVFGQSLMGLIIDITGWFHLPKRRTSKAKILSIAICYLGLFIMSAFSGNDIKFGYLLLAILAGIVTMIQMANNSYLATFKGPFVSALINVITGCITILVIIGIKDPSTTFSMVKLVPQIPFLLLVGGSFLGVVVVISTNIVIPKIPAVYSALLLSSGQILTSLVFDAALYSRFSLSLLIGVIIMILGLLYGTYADIKG